MTQKQLDEIAILLSDARMQSTAVQEQIRAEARRLADYKRAAMGELELMAMNVQHIRKSLRLIDERLAAYYEASREPRIID